MRGTTESGIRQRRRLEQGQFMVGGRRRVILGAEIHNSSSSTPGAIEESFAQVAALGATAVLAPIAWNLVEPEEGTFDFVLVDLMVETARGHDLSLIPLWFGSWKNGVSTYVPDWVKLDRSRFPRVRLDSGRVEVLTPFSVENANADARAFSAVMRRLRETDTTGIVELVQVENEVGLLGGPRDLNDRALEVWNADVPNDVLGAVRGLPGTRGYVAWVAMGSRDEGTWEQVFGSSSAADELFMATAYAAHRS